MAMIGINSSRDRPLARVLAIIRPRSYIYFIFELATINNSNQIFLRLQSPAEMSPSYRRVRIFELSPSMPTQSETFIQLQTKS